MCLNGPSGRRALKRRLGRRFEPEDLGGCSCSCACACSRSELSISCSSMERRRSSDMNPGCRYSPSSSWTRELRADDTRLWRMPRECDGRVASSAASSLRNMLDSVVRERCSADGRDDPASVGKGDVDVEGCKKRDSLLVLLERMGSRRRVGALERLPPSWLDADCGSWVRSRFARDDCLRRWTVLSSMTGAAGWRSPL